MKEIGIDTKAMNGLHLFTVASGLAVRHTCSGQVMIENNGR